ncbi:Hypothetical_protein [Hexamita inflata]|uniref:Hypothetical_protein n=1 Tax=Hexamita inflata TaxID=28002 RepID=A0AA86UP68_9EUKA|nr:Hypothetical protein HINF_LOCUS53832 [Hexamita inflata]CAI9966190.1 Hypothetical protein HINF_LOCUS53835 [Hexamita inflata]
MNTQLTAIIYKKKVMRRDEINNHEDGIPGNQNNRFAALAKDDIRIPKKNPHAAINEYLANTVRYTTQSNTSDDSEKVRKGKTEIEEAQEIKAETKAGYTCPAVDTINGISPTQY